MSDALPPVPVVPPARVLMRCCRRGRTPFTLSLPLFAKTRVGHIAVDQHLHVMAPPKLGSGGHGRVGGRAGAWVPRLCFILPSCLLFASTAGQGRRHAAHLPH
jgi:hypothetical protein